MVSVGISAGRAALFHSISASLSAGGRRRSASGPGACTTRSACRLWDRRESRARRWSPSMFPRPGPRRTPGGGRPRPPGGKACSSWWDPRGMGLGGSQRAAHLNLAPPRAAGNTRFRNSCVSLRNGGTVPIFAASAALLCKQAFSPRKWDCPLGAPGKGQSQFRPPCAAQKGTVPFSSNENWDSPQAIQFLPVVDLRLLAVGRGRQAGGLPFESLPPNRNTHTRAR